MLPQSTARSYLHDVQYPLGVLLERPRRDAFYCGIVGSRQRTLHLTSFITCHAANGAGPYVYPYAFQTIHLLSILKTKESPADGTLWMPSLSHYGDSNPGPTHYECVALPTEP